jgi:predicted aspartyl protease
MIVVDVRVNGMGPYPFLLDTGATSSEVDPQLSIALALPTAQSARLTSWNDIADARRVLVKDLSLGPIDSGPVRVLVQPLLEFKALDPDLRGVLGQDVLLHSNYLIDNRGHLIEFDNDGTLLPKLTGDRITIEPVRTRTGNLELRLTSVSVQSDMGPAPLHLLLDTGADMVVLQPGSAPPPSVKKGTKWIADQNGRRTSATTFHTLLTVGSRALEAEAWVGEAGLKQLAIDGLLPTGSFNTLYIDNQDSFVIFEPGRSGSGRVQQTAPRIVETEARSTLHP